MWWANYKTPKAKNISKFIDEERPYFERVGIDLGSKAYKMSQGQKVSRPKFIYLWMKIGKQNQMAQPAHFVRFLNGKTIETMV